MRLPRGGSATCCGRAWQAEYARRVRLVMRAFTRDGDGVLVWLSLPAPQDPARAAISRVVNAVVARTAPRVPGVIVAPLDRVLTPGFRFRRAMRHEGRRRVVRTSDGIHLTPAGAAIATELVLRALNRESRPASASLTPPNGGR